MPLFMRNVPILSQAAFAAAEIMNIGSMQLGDNCDSYP
jgi:hypothetical protein